MCRRKIRYLCAVDVKTPQGTNETKNLRIRIFNVSRIKPTNIFKHIPTDLNGTLFGCNYESLSEDTAMSPVTSYVAPGC